MAVKSFKQQRRKRATTHGFLVRSQTTSGKAVLRRRRQKGRARVAV